MSEGEDILRRDLIGRLLEGAEEEAEGAVVGVRGAGWSRSGAASRRGRRRASLASPCWNQRRRWVGSERKTWRPPWLGMSA